jgi:hypothetical protein
MHTVTTTPEIIGAFAIDSSSVRPKIMVGLRITVGYPHACEQHREGASSLPSSGSSRACLPALSGSNEGKGWWRWLGISTPELLRRAMWRPFSNNLSFFHYVMDRVPWM